MKSKIWLVTVLVLFLCMTVGITIAFAKPAEQSPNPGDLTAVLLWVIAGPGTAFLIGAAASFFAENWTFWQKLDPRIKFAITLVCAAILPFLAQLLLNVPGLVETLSPIWSMMVTGIVAWLGSQVTYVSIKNRDYARFAKG